MNDGRHFPNAANEIAFDPCRFCQHLDLQVASEDFLPQDLQLQVGQPITNAAVNAGTIA
jgi:hypothetical protein